MTIDKKATRQDEEVQTLRKFIKNRGEIFQPNLALYRGINPEVKEPCDISYRVEYQITYGDTPLIGAIREKTSKGEKYCEIGTSPEEDYAEKLLKKPLEDKRHKSDSRITLLIDCTYASTFWYSLSERETRCKKYFIDNEKNIGGSWQHIFVVFPDWNIQLR